MHIKEIIVVEGKKDTVKIKLAVDADTIETNGSAVSATVLDMISHAQKKRGVIIFTDPDYPGQRIRHIIEERVPGCKHAFLPKHQAIAAGAGKSVGIEHASVAAIREALEQVYESKPDLQTTPIEKKVLIDYGLIGGADARARREALGEALHIGYVNGKQLLHRLNMFHITKNELDSVMQHILGRGDHNGE